MKLHSNLTNAKLQASNLATFGVQPMDQLKIAGSEAFTPMVRMAGRDCNAGVFIIDSDTKKIFWCDYVQSIFGWDINQFETLQDWNKILKSNSGNLLTQFSNCFADQKGVTNRFFYEAAHQRMHVEFCIEPITGTNQLIGLIKDVTQEQEQQDHNHEQIQTFKAIFNNSGTPLALIDLKGRFIQINPSLEILLGYSRTQLLHKSFQDFTHPDDYGIGKEVMQQILNKEISQVEVEKRYLHKSGRTIVVSITSNCILDQTGNPKYLISQLRDVTDNKARELAQSNQTAMLQETIAKLQVKNTQLEDFGHIISHNLRTPAANLKMLCEILVGCTSDEERKEWIEAMENASDQMLATLDELMELVRYTDDGNLKSEPLKLDAILKQVVLENKVAMEELQPQIRTDFSAIGTVNYPKVYLRSIFSNMVSNAIKYRDENKKLHLTISSAVIHGNTVLKFTDNGIGIDLTKYGKLLFQLNQTFSKRKNAKGFGLFMVKRQLEVMGGHITCQSTVGTGTTFTVTL